ncbi:MAG: thioredoxin domain-containing protein [Rhodopirellula sp.]|nr:thioredoxin domain-containing protein [Rhodopirellula sp.]
MKTHLHTSHQGLLLSLILCLLLDSTVAAQQSPRVSETKPSDSSSEAGRDSDAKQERRVVRIIGDTKLDVRQWPLIGKPDAKYVFVEMFDYTCPHCRDLHHELDTVLKNFGDDLAVITLQVPLNATCNVQVGSTESQHRDACEIANLAVTVWRLEPRKYHEYHDWLFKPAQARTSADARKRAIEIVGEERMEKMLATGVPQKFIASHVKLYAKAGAGSIPKILFPNITLVGNVGSDRLAATIEQQLKTP